MENNEENKNQTPPKMARLAWPKAKYGVYLAFVIIFFIFHKIQKLVKKKGANKLAPRFLVFYITSR